MITTIVQYRLPPSIDLNACAEHFRKTHLLNTGRQAVALIERIGEPNLFVHLDTYQ